MRKLSIWQPNFYPTDLAFHTNPESFVEQPKIVSIPSITDHYKYIDMISCLAQFSLWGLMVKIHPIQHPFSSEKRESDFNILEHSETICLLSALAKILFRVVCSVSNVKWNLVKVETFGPHFRPIFRSYYDSQFIFTHLE
jgi:hypothetical protein